MMVADTVAANCDSNITGENKMIAIREYAVVKNGRIVLKLPESFEQMEVEVIVLAKEEKTNRLSEQSMKRPLGILKGKARCVIKDDFEMTDEELLDA
jgi:hypothetical protein